MGSQKYAEAYDCFDSSFLLCSPRCQAIPVPIFLFHVGFRVQGTGLKQSLVTGPKQAQFGLLGADALGFRLRGIGSGFRV